MFERIRDNLARGLAQLRWFAAVFSERMKIEVAVIKILYQSREMEEDRDALYRAIGKRVFELKDHPEKNALRDRTVLEAVAGIETLEKSIRELKSRIDEMSRAEV